MDFPFHHSQSSVQFSPALKHLRLSVTVCAWLVGLALTAQVLTWATVNFTDFRFQRITAAEKEGVGKAEIVTHDRRSAQKLAKDQSSGVVHLIPSGKNADDHAAQSTNNPSVRPDEVTSADSETAQLPEPAKADINYQLSPYDSILKTANNLAVMIGSAGIIALIIQLAVGVTVAAGAQARGIRRVVSAFNWSLALGAMLVPWQLISHEFAIRSLLTTYTEMCEISMRVSQSLPGAMPTYLFYAQFFFLPVAAVAAVALIGLRFSSGVESGIIPSGPTPEELAIEAEASQRKATSLHGSGRIGGALRNTFGSNSSSSHSAPAAPAAGPLFQNTPTQAPPPAPAAPPLQQPQHHQVEAPAVGAGTMKSPSTEPPLRRPI